jgi:hypothetical protein
MTATVPPAPPSPARGDSPAGGVSLRAALRWHRPLMVFALAMLALVVVGIVAIFADPRTVTGMPVWVKPTKFAVSAAVYAVTWAWLVDQIRARRGSAGRAHAAGTAAAVLLAVEMVVIVVQAARGTNSHFNVSTPFDTAVWTTMAVSIVAVWLATMYLAAGLFGVRDGDPARTLAIRAGAVLALVGMGIGFVMTPPTAAQIGDFQGIAGAHTVGLPDGGPGLALLGWSTVGGDLRVPHFIGMHALQVIPLLLIALELLATRVGVLRSSAVRRRLVVVGTAAYAAVVALATVQALRGQSVVAPDAITLLALAVIGVAAVVGVVLALRPDRSRTPA